MRIELEERDKEEIAEKLIEKIKPIINKNGKKEEDRVFDKKSLAKYLNISESTINKLVSYKQIPFFKIQQVQSGGVRFFKRDINRWIQKQTIPDINETWIKAVN